MNQEKLLPVILAIVTFAAGVYCVVVGDLALKTLSMITGWGLIFYGFSMFSIWMIRLRNGLADAWLLTSAVVSFVAGGVVWGSVLFHFESPLLVVYMLVGWGLVCGGLGVLHGLGLRTIRLTSGDASVAKRWIVQILVGVAMVVVGGYVVFTNPGSDIVALASTIAPCLIAGGIGIFGCFIAE